MESMRPPHNDWEPLFKPPVELPDWLQEYIDRYHLDPLVQKLDEIPWEEIPSSVELKKQFEEEEGMTLETFMELYVYPKAVY